MAMKRIQYALIAAVSILAFIGCDFLSPMHESSDGQSTTGSEIVAYFAIPDWNAPKDGTSLPVSPQVIDPATTTASLYIDDGASETLIDTVAVSPEGGSEPSDPERSASASFSGLVARTYAEGELVIYLSDGVSDLTRGVNLGSVTITAQGGQSIEFSSVPVGPTEIVVADANISASLLDGETAYYYFNATGGNTYTIDAARMSAAGDLDIYAFDAMGLILNDHYAVETQGEILTIYLAPREDGLVYIAVRAFPGNGAVDYDLDVWDQTVPGEYAISGTITMPSATAGNMVYFKVSGAGPTIMIEKEIARTGDTFLHYVIPGIPGTASGLTVWAVNDRDGNSMNPIDPGDVFANSGDYSGSLGTSISMLGGHRTGIGFSLEPLLAISGSFTFPAAVDGEYPMVLYLANEYGWPQAIYSPSTTNAGLSSFNFSAGTDDGEYRVGLIVDLDSSGGMQQVSDGSDIDAYLTEGDYFYLSAPVTVAGSSVTGLSYTAHTAAIVSGTVSLPQTYTGVNYVVFADSDVDYANGIAFGRYSYLPYSPASDTISYTLPVAAGSDFYIGALVDLSGGGRILSSGDLFAYYLGDGTDPPISPTNVSSATSGIDFTVSGYNALLSGNITIPAEVVADGMTYYVGYVDLDLWSAPGIVPGGTGAGGTFPYSLEGIPVGAAYNVAVVIDMDSNGFEASPNFGDIVGYEENLLITDVAGGVFDFAVTDTFAAAVNGTLSLPVSASNAPYEVWLSGDAAIETGVINGLSADYMLMDVPDGSYDLFAYVDTDSDGVLGNSGDYAASAQITIAGADLVGGVANLILEELDNLVSGYISLPLDVIVDAIYVATLIDASNPTNMYEDTGTIPADVDADPDGFSYAIFDVPDGEYTLSVHIDIDSDGAKNTGDYDAYYPFGEATGEIITLAGDIGNVNFLVTSGGLIP